MLLVVGKQYAVPTLPGAGYAPVLLLLRSLVLVSSVAIGARGSLAVVFLSENLCHYFSSNLGSTAFALHEYFWQLLLRHSGSRADLPAAVLHAWGTFMALVLF